jgi:hypothetical protein
LEISLIILMLLIAWFWFDSITGRERAIRAGRELAERWNLQLLDETVACSKIRLGRDSSGQIRLLRTYEFEVSSNGADRLPCHLVLLGKQLQSWHIPPYLQPMMY